jgi:hypothetical protein
MAVRVGDSVIVDTAHAGKLTGTVFSSDANFVTLHRTDYVTGKSSVSMVPASEIKNIAVNGNNNANSENGGAGQEEGGYVQRRAHVQYVKSDLWKPLSSADAVLPVHPSQKSIDERVKRAIDARMEKLGKGATAEAQQIFDILSKTLPCAWEGDTIVVMDEVRILPPYLPDTVMGDDPAVVARTTHVLTLTRQKMEQAAKS